MKFFTIIKPGTSIDFVSKSKGFFGLSILLIAGVFVLMSTKGFNFGIDFTGGTVVQVKFKEAIQSEQIRTALSGAGIAGASVVALGDADHEYLITVRGSEMPETPKTEPAPESANGQPAAETKPAADTSAEGNLLANALTTQFGAGSFEIRKTDTVGPKVGKELKASALRSLFYSIMLIMIYIWFRFDLKFAPGATLAMTHDLLIACGFYILSGREFTIASVAALLTIAGYSVNDTIVIYDRVRELFEKGGDDLPLGPTINRAINMTLSRTIITTLSTLLAVAALVVFTTGELQSFALAICVGVIVGTYSTLFIATPFTIFFDKFLKQRAASQQPYKPKKKAKA